MNNWQILLISSWLVSLGAQTAGYVGKLTPNLGRITGLDPAGTSTWWSNFKLIKSQLRHTKPKNQNTNGTNSPKDSDKIMPDDQLENISFLFLFY